VISALNINALRSGDELPVREFRPDTIQLFLYNAALWNPHRIHFDHPYATAVEGHAGLVVPGPLLGDWLTQCAVEWLGEAGRLVSVEYSNRRVSYVGEVLRSVGKVRSVDRSKAEIVLDLAILNQADEITTPGVAVIRLEPA
jgi:hydroxyacyl-ACP dehydratase HTD2-like protein with hotdog domain